MKIVRIAFYALVASNAALILFAPKPAPYWYGVTRIVVAVATIGCLAAMVALERRRR